MAAAIRTAGKTVNLVIDFSIKNEAKGFGFLRGHGETIHLLKEYFLTLFQLRARSKISCCLEPAVVLA
jgi:hypothetical protein